MSAYALFFLLPWFLFVLLLAGIGNILMGWLGIRFWSKTLAARQALPSPRRKNFLGFWLGASCVTVAAQTGLMLYGRKYFRYMATSQKPNSSWFSSLPHFAELPDLTASYLCFLLIPGAIVFITGLIGVLTRKFFLKPED